jgi:hypothetical protein
MKPGDVVLLKDKLYPCHCGIVTTRDDGVLMLVNAHYLDKVYEERFTSAMRAATLMALRLPGVTE